MAPQSLFSLLAAILSVVLFLGSCAGQPARPLDRDCADGLRQAQAELDKAKVDGFGDTVAWAKAASLLSAAKVQQQFEKYPNCVDKVQRARYYLHRIREQ